MSAAGAKRPNRNATSSTFKHEEKKSAAITFLGAAGTVTGSKHLLEAGGARLLLDCGLFQGLKELRLRNWQPPPVDPVHLDAVILSHAHIDHSGYLPRLVRSGFTGPVFCTRGTADLLAVMLPDAASLQEEEAAFARRRASLEKEISEAKAKFDAGDYSAALAGAKDLPAKAAEVAKGSGTPNKEKVGKVTPEQVRQIAQTKMRDLNTQSVDQAEKIIRGTARSMGIDVVEG